MVFGRYSSLPSRRYRAQNRSVDNPEEAAGTLEFPYVFKTDAVGTIFLIPPFPPFRRIQQGFMSANQAWVPDRPSYGPIISGLRDGMRSLRHPIIETVGRGRG